VSTESIVSPSPTTDAAAQCASCGVPMATDQRYCLECGQRRLPMSSVLEGPRPGGEQAPSASPATPAAPPRPPGSAPTESGAPANSTLTAIAGVGVLLLAMGVGVLIGRSTASKPGTAAPPVITVNAGGASGPNSNAASEASFTSDWPSGTKGYTVQLQTLPQSGTAVSAVEAAKSAATAKGAKSVGALRSEAFSSLSGSDYVIYSGVYHKRSEAQKALATLSRSFPGASVIEVSNSSGSASSEGAAGSSSGGGSNSKNPAPPSVLNNLKSAKGKSYAEKSKNLPNVISTG
jgi:hypothetical protein